MTVRADQLHQDYEPAHSTALVQAFLSAPYNTDLAPCDSGFPKAKSAFEEEEIFDCDCSAYVHLR